MPTVWPGTPIFNVSGAVDAEKADQALDHLKEIAGSGGGGGGGGSMEDARFLAYAGAPGDLSSGWVREGLYRRNLGGGYLYDKQIQRGWYFRDMDDSEFGQGGDPANTYTLKASDLYTALVIPSGSKSLQLGEINHNYSLRSGMVERYEGEEAFVVVEIAPGASCTFLRGAGQYDSLWVPGSGDVASYNATAGASDRLLVTLKTRGAIWMVIG